MPKLRLFVAGSFFLAWIGYLAFLVSITRDPVILSRPQFLVADLYVLAELGPARKDAAEPGEKVRTLKVYWSKDAAGNLDNAEVAVENLEKCQGWIGTGRYILPLTKITEGRYKLTEIPISPGFHQDKTKFNYLRIYPETEQAREQVKALIAEFHD